MTLKIYQYHRCASCRKALKWFDANGITYQKIDIDLEPPSRAEIFAMIDAHGGNIRPLFNTSGQLYREMKLRDQVAGMDSQSAAALLEDNGMLIKRPFVIGNGVALTGFNPDRWRELLG